MNLFKKTVKMSCEYRYNRDDCHKKSVYGNCKDCPYSTCEYCGFTKSDIIHNISVFILLCVMFITFLYTCFDWHQDKITQYNQMSISEKKQYLSKKSGYKTPNEFMWICPFDGDYRVLSRSVMDVSEYETIATTTICQGVNAIVLYNHANNNACILKYDKNSKTYIQISPYSSCEIITRFININTNIVYDTSYGNIGWYVFKNINKNKEKYYNLYSTKVGEKIKIKHLDSSNRLISTAKEYTILEPLRKE